MVIVKLTGGLGNQMFQYAAGRGVSYRSGLPLGLDISWFSQNYHNTKRIYNLGDFNIIENFVSIKFPKLKSKLSFLNKNYFKERKIFQFDPSILKISKNVYLDGYWQNENYFKDIKGIIYKEFTLKKPLSLIGKKIKEQIEKNNSVSLHIRRGDYIYYKKTNEFHGVCPLEYYKKAVEIIVNKIERPHFFIFSDDIDWAKNNLNLLPHSTFFVEKAHQLKDSEELILLSQCRHHIIANSSFSWWGAWLSDNLGKLVIVPQKWLNEKSIDTNGLLPNSWIRI